MKKGKDGIYCRYIKRVVDIICALAALVVLSPVLLIVAILVRVKLGSPVIFKQERPGKDEQIFTLHKFRTMTDAKDEEGNLLSDDVRLTRFGTKLRTTSLDELPELWNILRGEMSVIGPRPLVVEYLPLYNEQQRRRHEVKPGLSCLASINGRNDQSWEARFDWDIKYIESISFHLDWMIIFKTIWVVIKREGINAPGQATMEAFSGNAGEGLPG
ncbi:MAG: sugar transferase [Syntrophomonadaceae bacterium]|nr:sugar transferase [Syntrophomonadaceae bacterium]